MPNECSNRVTITSTCENDIVCILQEIKKEVPHVCVTQQSKLGLRLQYITAWSPNIHFFETMVNCYPFVRVKNEWISEDGTAGIWIGVKQEKKTLEWEDLSIEEESFYFPS